MGDVENTVRSFIVRSLMLKKDESAIEFDDQLLESGVINSFGIVELVTFLEPSIERPIKKRLAADWRLTLWEISETFSDAASGAPNSGRAKQPGHLGPG